jgi:serine phosphatase RsbU (regulator of sigma subunit)
MGKFVVALLVAAALPFGVGLVVFENNGYQHLLSERGKLHEMEAMTLVKALEQASFSQGETLMAWIEADSRVIDALRVSNQSLAARLPEEVTREIRTLDEIWAGLPLSDPRVGAILENPASESLRRFQQMHPEVAEVMATDRSGRLIAATGKTSDLGQADEAWWTSGAALPERRIWTDVLKHDDSADVFSLDVVLPLYGENGFQGVVKMSVNVTSLFTKLGFDGEAKGERWEIALPDGKILASSRAGYASFAETLPAGTLDSVRKSPRGWLEAADFRGDARLIGHVAMGMTQGEPNAYVMFSSARDDVVGPLRRSFLQIGLAAAALLGVCAMVGFQLIRSNILLPLKSLGTAARSIAATARLRGGDHEEEEGAIAIRDLAEAKLRTIEGIRTGDEIEALAADFAVMTSRVLQYHRELEAEVAAKTSVIREDLEMAREFQNSLMPSEYPQIPARAAANPLRLQFAHFYQPASTVGGDFFDLIELDENRAGVLIADVMGHGARSALITAILRALVRNRPRGGEDPGLFLSDLNRHLLDVISRSGQTLFVTAFFLVLDTLHGKAHWAVAGHPAPLRVRRGSGKTPEPLWTEPQHQPALGLLEDAEFRTHEAVMKPGDVFLLFTDGALEAENPTGEPFGIARLIRSFDQALDGPMAAMPAKIVCDVTAYQRRRNYDDDVCLVAVEALSTTENAE